MKPSSTDTQEIEQAIEAGQGGNAEQAADLAALQAEADAAPRPPGEPEPEAPPAPPDLAAEIAGALLIASKMLAPMFPSLGTIYTEESTGAAGAAVAGVCDKYGWLQGGMVGQWGPEIACLVVVGPLAMATVKGVQADNAERRRREAEERSQQPDQATMGAPVPSEAIGQKTVTFGGAAA